MTNSTSKGEGIHMKNTPTDVPSSHVPPDAEITGAQTEPMKEELHKKGYGKNLPLVLIVFCIVLGLIAWKYTSAPAREPDTEEVTSGQVQLRQTTLTIDASQVSASGGDTRTYSVPIVIDTGSNTVSAVDLFFDIDPASVISAEVTPGAFFAEPTVLRSTIDTEQGHVVFTVGSLTPVQGVGTVALFSWTVPGDQHGSLGITFTDKTQVAAIGETGTVLKSAQGATVEY